LCKRTLGRLLESRKKIFHCGIIQNPAPSARRAEKSTSKEKNLVEQYVFDKLPIRGNKSQTRVLEKRAGMPSMPLKVRVCLSLATDPLETVVFTLISSSE
jgi:hypothetical protein